MIYKNEKNKEGKFDIQIEEDGEYRLCFRSTDRQEKYVSFDFHVSGKEDQGKAVTTSKFHCETFDMNFKRASR